MTEGTTKRRIVLVDDEMRIVQGLQRALRMHREAWDVVTATSGPAALELFDGPKVDVIITDMRMAEMDGATLLAHVKERHPATMRIVLSGQTDARAAFRAMPVAHQFLNKPTDPSSIGELLVRTAAMKDALPDEAVHIALGGLESLPSRASVREAIARCETEETAVAIVERDPALVLKLLQSVNSSFFGLRRDICDIRDAIAYLGLDLSKEVCAVGGSTDDVTGNFDSAVEVARLARSIAGGHERGAVAYAAALFEDIARLVPTNADRRKVAIYLLDLWGIPRVVMDAVNELPDVAENLGARAKLMPADAVYIAKCLREGIALPTDYLARLGVAVPVIAA